MTPSESDKLEKSPSVENHTDGHVEPLTQALVPIEPAFVPTSFRVRLTGNPPPDEAEQDAAVLAYEYERRRTEWWRWRRFGLIGLPSLAIISLFTALLSLALGPTWATLSGLFNWLFWLFLITSLLFAIYSFLTLPRVVSFGRAYRRLVSVPLARTGIAWCDAAIAPPNFPGLRDSFFTLYQDSRDLSTHAQPADSAQDTERKKQTLHDLQALLNPSQARQAAKSDTPFVSRERTLVLDRVELEPINWQESADLALHSLPTATQHLNTPLELQRLAQEIETYASMRAETDTAPDTQTGPLHSQIAVRVGENFSLVGSEIDRWRDHSAKEKTFHNALLTHYKEAEESVRLNYERVILGLEEEIQPAVAQLEADATFYQSELENFYRAQREVIESRRDTALSKLDRERGELDVILDERMDEQALLQAESRSLNDHKTRLENSTDHRFSSLRSSLADLVRHSYNLPTLPYFRSDYQEEPSAADAQQCLQQLAELRAETRLATSAVSNSLNRFAKLRFEPLDELARLETQIAGSNKWQATNHLVNLVNFKQSGQLLALAGEVSESVSVYLDSVTDFERLNRRWCGLEASIRTLGLAAYNNRLQEAQEYLVGLSQVTASLHSSLLSAPHSPEMARPTTFQNIYDLAAGLQRELEELGALATSISRTEDTLGTLNEELANVNADIEQNKAEVEQIQTDASIKIYEISQKLKHLLEKLNELKTNRIKNIRAHIDAVVLEKATVLKQFWNGTTELGELSITADKILRNHIYRAEHLLTEARHLHKGLESTIAGIVQDFDASVLPDRHLRAPSELFVTVWYFQFKERPVWQPRILGFASCYTAMDLTPFSSSLSVADVVKERSSFWRFISSSRPTTFYRLREDQELATLVGAQMLDYPAGQAGIAPEYLDKLVAEGWLSRWLVRIIKISLRGIARNETRVSNH